MGKPTQVQYGKQPPVQAAVQFGKQPASSGVVTSTPGDSAPQHEPPADEVTEPAAEE